MAIQNPLKFLNLESDINKQFKEILSLCNIKRFILTDKEQEKIDLQPIWNILPIAASTKRLNIFLGIRLIPGLAINQSPLLEVEGFEARTIANYAQYLVPRLIFDSNVYSNSPELWDAIKNLDQSTTSSFLEFNKTFNGKKESLENTLKIFQDEELRTKLYDFDEESFYKVIKTIDLEKDHLVLRDFIRTIDDSWEVPQPTPDFGRWEIAGICTAFHGERNINLRPATKGKNINNTIMQAWQVINLPPNIDTSINGLISQKWYPSNDIERTSSWVAIQFLVENEQFIPENIMQDKWWIASKEMYLKKKKYDFSAHLKAYETIKAKGDFIRCFNILISIDFWHFYFNKKLHPDIKKEAKNIAKISGWKEIIEILS